MPFIYAYISLPSSSLSDYFNLSSWLLSSVVLWTQLQPCLFSTKPVMESSRLCINRFPVQWQHVTKEKARSGLFIGCITEETFLLTGSHCEFVTLFISTHLLGPNGLMSVGATEDSFLNLNERPFWDPHSEFIVAVASTPPLRHVFCCMSPVRVP